MQAANLANPKQKITKTTTTATTKTNKPSKLSKPLEVAKQDSLQAELLKVSPEIAVRAFQSKFSEKYSCF